MIFPATVTDQMNTPVKLDHTPRRIISLVPSQTELLFDLGLTDEVVGITKFCIHPDEWFRTKTRIGGTKDVNAEKIVSLHPDLIIGNKEENEETQIRELQGRFPVWMSDIHNLNDALKMITSVGEIVARQQQAEAIATVISENFKELQKYVKGKPWRTCAYFIWRNPFMAAGTNTFIDAMMKEMHLQNVFSSSRYPESTLQDLKKLSPEVVFLSSEPYPFSEKHIQEISDAVPKAKIYLVDGEMFSWYGSRLQHSPDYFRRLLVKIAEFSE